jgi:hypothetical protein
LERLCWCGGLEVRYLACPTILAVEPGDFVGSTPWLSGDVFLVNLDCSLEMVTLLAIYDVCASERDRLCRKTRD